MQVKMNKQFKYSYEKDATTILINLKFGKSRSLVKLMMFWVVTVIRMLFLHSCMASEYISWLEVDFFSIKSFEGVTDMLPEGDATIMVQLVVFIPEGLVKG